MKHLWTRREVVATAICAALPRIALGENGDPMRTARIPASGELLPVIGLGTYSVFDVESSESEIAAKADILQLLTSHGGSVIDTSPMYNRSEQLIGDLIRSGVKRQPLFLATKVWIDGRDAGIEQMNRSAQLMNTQIVDLMQVHNLRDTAVHIETIRDAQAQGRIRYSGLTHYTASAHAALEREMREFKPDFIQINYSLGEREAEQRILPLARDLGIAVLINRPFQAGKLFRRVAGRPLPDFARAFADSWGQLFLKFIISHPAVTCAIPATSKPHHMADNLGAGFGELPDSSARARMFDFFSNL
jgi:diketogulonate reductase-like aldo/keto reductase